MVFLSAAVKPLFADGKLLHAHSLERCPVCEKGAFAYLFTARGFAHHRCLGCGFLFVNPRLNETGARLYYNSDYYRAYCDFNERPINEADGPYCRTFGDQLTAFVETVREICPAGRVVDVGCGLGGLLAALPADAYERIGVEFNDAAADFARSRYGLRIAGSMSDLAAEQGTVDLVTAVEVIEHVAEPFEWLRDVVKLISPSGTLIITTPNIDSLDFRLYGERCQHFCAPSHVNFFGVKTLTTLARRTGLRRESYSYRGGVVGLRHWWKTRGTVLDFWSPEGPTRCSGNVVYRRSDGTLVDPIPATPLTPVAPKALTSQESSTVRATLSKLLHRALNAVAAQTQMIVTFRRL